MGVLLGKALKAAREARGLRQKDLAQEIGVSSAAVGQWENGKTEPSTEHLIRVCDLLNINLAAATGGMVKLQNIGSPDKPEDSVPIVQDRRPDFRHIEDELLRLGGYDPTIRGDIKDVPVLGVAAAGNDADFYMNGEIIDYVRRPLGVSRMKDVYAIYVVGSSMSPRYEEGEVVYVSPRRPPQIGDYVIIELKPDADDAPTRAFLKRLSRRAGSKIFCEQFNPPRSIEIDAMTVKSLHRVIPWTELLGV